jgi:hypothetical protein
MNKKFLSLVMATPLAIAGGLANVDSVKAAGITLTGGDVDVAVQVGLAPEGTFSFLPTAACLSTGCEFNITGPVPPALGGDFAPFIADANNAGNKAEDLVLYTIGGGVPTPGALFAASGNPAPIVSVGGGNINLLQTPVPDLPAGCSVVGAPDPLCLVNNNAFEAFGGNTILGTEDPVKGTKWLTFKESGGDTIEVWIKEIDLLSIQALSSTPGAGSPAQATFSGTANFVSDNIVLGNGSFNSTFNFGDQQTSGSGELNFQIQVPEPSTVLGSLIAFAAASFSFRKKSES